MGWERNVDYSKQHCTKQYKTNEGYKVHEQTAKQDIVTDISLGGLVETVFIKKHYANIA